MTTTTSIGVFDSGFGGLTVLRALIEQLPGSRFTYIGDTARLPYGSKSQKTIARYAVESARFLVEERGAEYLVIACNTASALAMEAIRAAVRVPVLGVIEPGAAEAAKQIGDVAVIATAATVESHAYAEACARRGVRALEKACPLLVPLVEEGWIRHPVTRQVAEIYLKELLEESAQKGFSPHTLVLGCTHYPLLKTLLEELVPAGMKVIDSAAATARAAAEMISSATVEKASTRPAELHFYATDSVEKFRRLGSRFLNRELGEVHLVDLGG